MEHKVIAVDLAKDVFELAVTDDSRRIRERHRLTRSQFANFMANQDPARVVMEACGTAHFWARAFESWGHLCVLLPAHYVRPYRRRNKTDRTDAEALLEADRCEGIHPVAIKSVDQQQLQQLHRLREQWKRTRTARINALRGALREFGINFPVGATALVRSAAGKLDSDAVPLALRAALVAVLDEIAALQLRIRAVEKQLHELTRMNDAVTRLQKVPGVGLLTSTALVASAGSPSAFKSGRHLSSWVGLTPRESSSGARRHLGSITKRGDVYLRMLFVHGARSVLARAKQLAKADRAKLSRLQQWAIALERRVGHNKATVALANKLIRTAWAVWRYERPFDPQFVGA